MVYGSIPHRKPRSADSTDRSSDVMAALTLTALSLSLSLLSSGAMADAGLHYVSQSTDSDTLIIDFKTNARRLKEIESRRQADLEEQAQKSDEYRQREMGTSTSKRGQTQNNQNVLRPIEQASLSKRNQVKAPSFASPYIVEPNNTCLVHENRSDQPGWNNRCDSSIEVYWCTNSSCEVPDTHVTVVANGWTNAITDASQISVCPAQYILRSDHKCHGHSK